MSKPIPPGTYTHPTDLWTYHVLFDGSVVAKHRDGRTKVLQYESPGERAVAEQVATQTLTSRAGPAGETDSAVVDAALAERTSRNDLGDVVGSGAVKAEPAADLGESDLPLRGEPGYTVTRRVDPDLGESPLPLAEKFTPDLDESPTSRDTGESTLTAQDAPAPREGTRNPDKDPKNLMERIRNVVADSAGPGGQGPFLPATGGTGKPGIGDVVHTAQNWNQLAAQRAPLKKAADAARARDVVREREYDRDWAAVQSSLAPSPAAPVDSTFAGDYDLNYDAEPPVVRRATRVAIADRDAPG